MAKLFGYHILVFFFIVQKCYAAPKLGARQIPGLSLFSIVEFPNDECILMSNNAMMGICMTSEECTNVGGTSDGNCASGFGICCRVVIRANDGTVNQNITYVQNPNFPQGETTATALARRYTINPVASSPAVCQIRLNFDTLVLTQPDSTADHGACNQDMITFTSPTGGGVILPTLCGTLTGQHIYLETGGMTPAATFTITTNAVANNNRMWNIKVLQIPCHTRWTAPDDCLQYHTGRSGNFRGFNHPAGNTIQGQLYNICIRQEEGSCSIAYSVRIAMQGVDPFQVMPPKKGARVQRARRDRNSCGNANLLIHGDVALGPKGGTGPIFCGGSLNENNDNQVDGVVTSFRTPFTVSVFTASVPQMVAPTTPGGGSPNGDAGFSLQYTQLGCGNRFSLT